MPVEIIDWFLVKLVHTSNYAISMGGGGGGGGEGGGCTRMKSEILGTIFGI